MIIGKDENVGYYHVCTDGNAIPWMFQDDEDFIAGVNRIALCLLRVHVEVIAFILMDNHVHFILYGSMLQCKQFINHYKMLTGRWIADKYGIKEHLRLLPAEIIRIEDEDSLLNTLAYIDRNSIMAGYKFMPCEYPWGSARYLFRDMKYDCHESEDFKELRTIGIVRQRAMFKTRMTLPDDWKVDHRGMVYPGSFMDFSRIERMFKSPTRYNYFLAKKLEGHVEMQFSQARKSFMPDKELRTVVKKLSLELFGTDQMRSLDVNSRIAIAKRLRYDYASTLKQISRMVYLETDVLSAFI